MGLRVLDEVVFGHLNITLSNFVLTCHGRYNIEKVTGFVNQEVGVTDGPTRTYYKVTTNLSYTVSGGNSPFYREPFSMDVCCEDITDASVFTLIYDQLKARYTSYQNV